MNEKVQVLLTIRGVACIEIDVLHEYFNELCTHLVQVPQKKIGVS
jgi:hypothetical protein